MFGVSRSDGTRVAPPLLLSALLDACETDRREEVDGCRVIAAEADSDEEDEEDDDPLGPAAPVASIPSGTFSVGTAARPR